MARSKASSAKSLLQSTGSTPNSVMHAFASSSFMAEHYEVSRRRPQWLGDIYRNVSSHAQEPWPRCIPHSGWTAGWTFPRREREKRTTAPNPAKITSRSTGHRIASTVTRSSRPLAGYARESYDAHYQAASEGVDEWVPIGCTQCNPARTAVPFARCCRAIARSEA